MSKQKQSVEGAIRAVREAAKELAEEAEQHDEMRRLGMIEHQAIAAVACNATAAFVKVHGGFATTWQALTQEHAGQMIDVVRTIESGLRLGVPTFLNDKAVPLLEVPGMFGPPADFFLGVAEAAVKLETGWKPAEPAPSPEVVTKEPESRSLWDQMMVAVSVALSEAHGWYFPDPMPDACTVEVNDKLWAEANKSEHRITIAGSAEDAKSDVVHSMWLPLWQGVKITVRPIKALQGRGVVVRVGKFRFLQPVE